MEALETGRLLLRPVMESDAADIYEYCRERNVGINAGWKPHESIEETRGIMRFVFLDREYVFGIVLKDTGKMIGSIGLIPDPKRQNDRARMIGYAIGERYWGKGFMTEAVCAALRFGFEELELDLVSAYCYPFNERSKRVLAKCGFQYEGCLRLAEKRYDGVVVDNECYAVTHKSKYAMKHLLSESAVWQTVSEFVTPDGKISRARGESVISINERGIINESRVESEDFKRTNSYKITPVSQSEFPFESLNPGLGKQTGIFHADRNTLFSKFRIEGRSLNGYEIIRREGDACQAQGALYDGDSLVNTWTATMNKE